MIPPGPLLFVAEGAKQRAPTKAGSRADSCYFGNRLSAPVPAWCWWQARRVVTATGRDAGQDAPIEVLSKAAFCAKETIHVEVSGDWCGDLDCAWTNRSRVDHVARLAPVHRPRARPLKFLRRAACSRAAIRPHVGAAVAADRSFPSLIRRKTASEGGYRFQVSGRVAGPSSVRPRCADVFR